VKEGQDTVFQRSNSDIFFFFFIMQKKKGVEEKEQESSSSRRKVEGVEGAGGDDREEEEEEEEETVLVPTEKDVSMRSISMSSEMEHLEPTGPLFTVLVYFVVVLRVKD
jgi:hypothetical protein